MVFFFIFAGALLGAAMGGVWGSLIGGAVAFGAVRFIIKYKQQEKQEAEGPKNTPAAAADDDPAVLTRKLMLRIQALEQRVVHLESHLQLPSVAASPEVAVPEQNPVAQLEEVPATDTEAALDMEALSTPPVEPELIEDNLIKPSTELPVELPVEFSADPISEAAPPKQFKDYIPARLHPFVFGGNTIVKVGVLVLFLGLSFLLKYVAEQVTAPIEVRYAAVAMLGVGLLGLGWRLRHRQDASGGQGYGLILQGAGVGVFYLTTLAAMKLHPLLSAPSGFAIMALVTAFAALLAVAQNAAWLAMVAASAGFATPVLVSTGNANHMALFTYLAILDLGIVAMAWFRAWRPLNLIGFVGTFTLASAWATSHYTPDVYPSTQAFLVLFFLIFTAVGVLFARRALALASDADLAESIETRAVQALQQIGRVDSALVFGVPLAAYSLQYLMVRDDPWLPALSALVMGLFYMLLGAALWRGKLPRYALLAEAYVVVGVLFGTLSVPLALEGEWTSATWAIEAAGMYWLGTRQHRTYTRAFALALLAGAGLQLLMLTGWSDAPDAPWLTGSWMSVALMAVSTLVVGVVHRQAKAIEASQGIVHPAWEQAGITGVWWLMVTSFVVLPWLLLMPLPASVVTAGLALACIWIGQRAGVSALQLCTPVVHMVSIGGFVSTLHQAEGQLMLANGWQGLVAAVLIGVSMLGSAWMGVRDIWYSAISANGEHAGQPPAWPLGSSIALLVGVALINGALLFLLPLEHAVLVWPIVGCLLWWAGLRLAWPAVVGMGAGLQVFSALAFMVFGETVWPLVHAEPQHVPWQGPMGGLAWWTPLALAVSAVVSALVLHRAATRAPGWSLSWVKAPWLHMLWLAVSLWWWSQTMPPEITRLLLNHDLMRWQTACMCLWITFTSTLMYMLAARQNWPLMGQAAALTIPLWAVCLLNGPAGWGDAPLAELGWLAWAVALVWHPVALRQSQRWWAHSHLNVLHTAGFWLFGFIAARQVQWQVESWTTSGTAWHAMGWLLVPLMLVGSMSAPAVGQRWPMREFPKAYQWVGPLPFAITVLCWLVWSLFNAGHAAPLPYVPLLNPLELGQGLAMLTMLAWSRVWPANVAMAIPTGQLRFMALGGAGFAVLTTMVLRACHHWAGVPWQEQALFNSTLTQAALSVTWSLLGVGLMLLGHKRGTRLVWGLGAALLAVVVAKLFFIELADHGGLYRIVSFIVVGLLLLLVGYFAPVPPAADSIANKSQEAQP